MISVIIPAHNEASNIAATLARLLEGAFPEELDVIVVCNGCRDTTAKIARGAGSAVRVIETAVANKANALNIGDKVAGLAFPRFYVDADVSMTLETLRTLARRLNQGDLLAVAPVGHIDTASCSWMVRWFSDIAALLPSASQCKGGSGVYALSRSGRSRFDAFPDIIADDAFVRIQFTEQECETIPGLYSMVRPPRTIWDLIRVRTRVRYGHIELARSCPRLWTQNWPSNSRSILDFVGCCSLWPKLAVYLWVTLAARWKANRRFESNVRIWERDAASRAAASHQAS